MTDLISIKDFKIPAFIPERHQKILKDLADGMSVLDVNRKYSTDHNFITKLLKRYKLKDDYARASTTPKEVSQIHKIIGMRIAEVRIIERNLEKLEVASKANMSQRVFTSIEEGKRDVTVMELKNIADALDVRLQDLLETAS